MYNMHIPPLDHFMNDTMFISCSPTPLPDPLPHPFRLTTIVIVM